MLFLPEIIAGKPDVLMHVGIHFHQLFKKTNQIQAVVQIRRRTGLADHVAQVMLLFRRSQVSFSASALT